MRIKHLVNINTLEDLKKTFRVFAFKFHPDRGGNIEDMQQLNNEYSYLSEKLSNLGNEYNKTVPKGSPAEAYKKTEDTNEAEQFKDIIERLVNLKGLEIEICGTWIYLRGNTKEHKETIKEMAFRWSKKKICWYFGIRKGNGRGKMEMEDIRNKYGSTIYNGKHDPQLT